MKKHLLLFLLVFGFCALASAQKKPYNNLIITEARFNMPSSNYFEITNRGTETIDLSEFKLCAEGPSGPSNVWLYNNARSFKFPKVMLGPGKSYVVSSAYDASPRRWLIDPKFGSEVVTQPEMFKLANYMFHMEESGSPAVKDSVTPHSALMNLWTGSFAFLKHIYTIDGVLDSMIIDQVGGVFDEQDGTNYTQAYDVAGVKNATDNSNLIRKHAVRTGITEFADHASNEAAAAQQFNNSRGLDLADSEWIPVPFNGGNPSSNRAVFWTVGNDGDYRLDANTLVSKVSGKIQVDLNQGTITVPWGIRYNDSIMYQFERKPGLAWNYIYAPTREDSSYTSIRNGDKLTLYVCGDEASIKTFSFVVSAPTPSDNIVMPKTVYDNERKRAYRGTAILTVSDGVRGMDTISRINFGTRVDTLYTYLEKAPKASWEVVPKDGMKRLDARYGDKLVVTSENGKVKEYFLKLLKYEASDNASLSSITWPDMPSFFKGDLAKFYGWKGDTIPTFTSGNYNYILKIPGSYDGIPSLQFTKADLNATVKVERAKTLDGTLAEATVNFTVTAEDGKAKSVYLVRFEKPQDAENVQKFVTDPIISQVADMYEWVDPWLEIANPGTEPLDLSHYMIGSAMGDMPTFFNSYNTIDDWASAYTKYVPGKKWQDEANWSVQPRMLEPDLSTNAMLAPGGVFVLTACVLRPDRVYPKVDFNFRNSPWGTDVRNGWGQHAIRDWGRSASTIYLFKILNDSVINGTKPATDINDFKLIDVFGHGVFKQWEIGGVSLAADVVGITRKPSAWKGNPEYGGSFGTTPENSEWNVMDVKAYQAAGITSFGALFMAQLEGFGSQIINPVGVYKSTISSVIYKVSPGYTYNESIRGLTTGTTVSDFYDNIIKEDSLQILKVESSANGNELAESSMISNGDILVVLSADSVNTTKYKLDVTATGLSSNAILTSATYTIDVLGTTGTISGFPKNTLLKTVFAGISVPVGATLTIVDENDAYMSLVKLNYDTVYVNVNATDKIYFEVIAENGKTKIVYQLKPTTSVSDAFVTSDVYSVDQFSSLIGLIPGGTNVSSLLNNVTHAPGATVYVADKAGLERATGAIYRDDKLVVTSADGTTIKAYYFSMLNFLETRYLAYVISDDYLVNQIAFTITGPVTLSVNEFFNKLYPSFGANLLVVDKAGIANTTGTFKKGDKLLVTAADGMTTATYDISMITKAIDVTAETIKMYPNPTDGRVIVQGLAKGNRVRVFNATGVALRDVIVNNSTEYVSLAAQPAGIYIFVISSGDKYINIQKIIKK